jgi:teichuronic acid biosynthesis glycosyltransferase TuaC
MESGGVGQAGALGGFRGFAAISRSVFPLNASEPAVLDAPALASARQPLHVLFLIPGAAVGSSMVFAVRQAASLRREGVDVHMFHLRSRTSPVELWREWGRFRKEVSAIHPAVIHAHFGTVTAAFAAAAGGRIPLVITYRGSDLNPGTGTLRARMRAASGRFLSQLASLRAERVVCVSRHLKDRLWWAREKAIVLPSGVDPEQFYCFPQEQARKNLAWPREDRVVLFNAGHSPHVKRLDLAEAAVRAARQLDPRIRMEVMHGTTPPDRVPLLMNACDCLLLTSDSEGSPTVVQEALACNLPVVSVDVGDTPEVLAGVRNTRIVPRDPVRIGAALVEVISLGERSDGRRKVQEFSLSRIAGELRRVYEAVQTGVSRGAPSVAANETRSGCNTTSLSA